MLKKLNLLVAGVAFAVVMSMNFQYSEKQTNAVSSLNLASLSMTAAVAGEGSGDWRKAWFRNCCKYGGSGCQASSSC